MKAILLWSILISSTLQGSYGSSILNTPCQTFDKFQEALQCSINNTIYIREHIIEDGFQKISYTNAIWGCKEKNRLVCSASLPRDQKLFQTHFASNCNLRNVCDTKPILRKIEKELKTKVCSKRQELKNATIRHSVECLCIPETQQENMCKNKMSKESHLSTFFNSYNCSEECYCDLKGLVSNISILESYNTAFIVSNSLANFSSALENVWTYNRIIQVNSNKDYIRIHIRPSLYGRFLAKINGQFSFNCMIMDRKRSTDIGNESTQKRSTQEMMNHKITSSLSPGRPVAKGGKWSTLQNKKMRITTMENPTQWQDVFTTFRVKNSENTQMQHLNKMPAKEQDIARYVIYFIAGMILLGLIFMVISVLQKRKEKDMLEMILQRLQAMSNSSFPQIKPSSSNRKSETFADITYHQIPVDIKVQTNGKSVQKATDGIDNSTHIYSLCKGEDLTNKMEVDGAYELQKITD